MADSFVQVAPDSSGKKLQTYENNINGVIVESEAVVLTDNAGTPLGTNVPLNVYLGQITVNAGANLNTAALALSAAQTNGGQKTQIIDPANASNSVGVTNLALDVNLKSPTTVPVSAVSLPLPSGAALAAAQTNGGQKTLIVDPINASNVAGITNGALNVYLSFITANAGTNLNTVGLGALTNGTQKTQIVDPANASNSVGVTNLALDVNLKSSGATVFISDPASKLAMSVIQTNGAQKTQIVDPSNASNSVGVTNLALDINLKSPNPLPISATSLPLPSGAALAAAQTNGGQKTQIVDPVNASNAAGVTNSALNVYLTNIGSLALAAAQTNGGQKTLIVDPSNASNSAGIIGGIGGSLNVRSISEGPDGGTAPTAAQLIGANVAGTLRGIGASVIGLGTTYALYTDIQEVKGGQPTVTGVIDAAPRKLDGATAFSQKYFASRINSVKNTFVTNTTCYLSSIKIAITNGVAGSTMMVSDESGLGNRQLISISNMAAISLGAYLGNYLENYIEPQKMTGGININTGGATFGDCNVFVSYWQ